MLLTLYSRSLITTAAAPAATAYTLNRLLVLELGLGHTANASRVEISFLGLNTTKTA